RRLRGDRGRGRHRRARRPGGLRAGGAAPARFGRTYSGLGRGAGAGARLVLARTDAGALPPPLRRAGARPPAEECMKLPALTLRPQGSAGPGRSGQGDADGRARSDGERRGSRHLRSPGLRVALLTEGTYPYVDGGVSTWCHILCQQLREVEFSIYAVTGDTIASEIYTPTPNRARVVQLPQWCTEDIAEYVQPDVSGLRFFARKAATRRPPNLRPFLDAFARLLDLILRPDAV